MFEINVVNPANPIGTGEIAVSEFREKFEMSFEFWLPSQYEQQWRISLAAILSGAPKSMLLASVTDPQTAAFLRCWPIYRVGEDVVIQQQIFMLDETRESFSFDRLEDFVDPRESIDEDGNQISEWTTTTTTPDVRRFLSRCM